MTERRKRERRSGKLANTKETYSEFRIIKIKSGYILRKVFFDGKGGMVIDRGLLWFDGPSAEEVIYKISQAAMAIGRPVIDMSKDS